MAKVDAPTIIVGLGGIGSQVVDRIFGKVKKVFPDHEGWIHVHALDTNALELNSKLEHLDPNTQITQTSPDMTVGQYLRRTVHPVDDWFQTDVPILLKKTMTDGAGQVRAVSRLSYRSAMERNDLGRLISGIDSMFKLNANKFTASPRIVIVCSLVGGTGSGMFLQTALYLREHFLKEYNRKNTIIRGSFILPSVLINTLELARNQHKDIMANAYASLKELDGIITAAHGGGKSMATIHLEYRPGQEDDVITANHDTFDGIQLYDYQGLNNRHLSSEFEPYLSQVVDTIYLYLFSPMGSAAMSAEDNHIRSIAAHYGRSRYGGCGVAHLIYPYQDIVEYCALSWAKETIGKQWLYLDKEFQRAVLRFKQEAAFGGSKPRIEQHFVEQFDLRANDGDAFFEKLHKTAHILDEDDHQVAKKSQVFLDELESRINILIQDTHTLNQRFDSAQVDIDLLKNRDTASGEVNRVENELMALESDVRRFSASTHRYLVEVAVSGSCDPNQPLSILEDILLHRPKPLHPVAMRYVLYQVQQALERLAKQHESDAKELEDSIKNYKEAYDLPDTHDILETAADRVQKAIEQGALGRMMGNKLTSFAKEYQEGANTHRARLKLFLDSGLRSLVYRGCLRMVEMLQKEWKGFFENLVKNQSKLSKMVSQESKRHMPGRKADRSKEYVLASDEHKENAWINLSAFVSGDDLDPDAATSIHRAIFERFCDLQEKADTIGWKAPPPDYDQLFEERVLAWFRKAIDDSENLKMNVVRALQTEASLYSQNSGKYIVDKLDSLTKLSQPLVPTPLNVNDPDTQRYWGLHPTCNSDIRNIGVTIPKGGWSVNDAFPDSEIVLYTGIYGLKASNFRAFAAESDSGPGEVYQAYKERLSQLHTSAQGTWITPHLDRNWHLPAYFPDFNEGQAERDQTNLRRAFLLGIVHNLFWVVQVDLGKFWEYRGEGRSSLLTVDGNKVPNTLSELYNAMAYNPREVDWVLGHARKIREEERKLQPTDVRDHRFIKGCRSIPKLDLMGVTGEVKTILDVVLRLHEGTPPSDDIHKDYPAIGKELLTLLMDEIEIYFKQFFTTAKPTTAACETWNTINELHKLSAVIQRADEDTKNEQTYRDWVYALKERKKQVIGNTVCREYSK